MAAGWHYRLLGIEFGPVPFESLGTLAAAGDLAHDSEIRQGLDGEWVRASSIAGLFPAASDPPESEDLQDLSDLDFHFVDNTSRKAAVVTGAAPLEPEDPPSGSVAENCSLHELAIKSRAAPKRTRRRT